MFDGIQTTATPQHPLAKRPVAAMSGAHRQNAFAGWSAGPLAGGGPVTFSHSEAAESLALVLKVVQEHLRDAFGEFGPPLEESEVLYPTGVSASDVADTIFRGISGGIFSAYLLSKPEMSEEDFDTFVSEVFRGVEAGVSEARGVLASMDAMTSDLGSAIKETESLLHQRLEGWIEDTREQMFGSAESEREIA